LRKSRFIVIGQLPPPVHGSNIMTALFLESIQRLGHEVDIVQKTFSQKIAEVGKFSVFKIAKIPVIGFRLIRQILRRKPDFCFYFNTVSLFAFLLDAIFMFILRLFGVPYALYSHGKGLSELDNSHHYLLRYIVHRTIGGAAGALVLGELLKEDLSPFLDADRMHVLPNAIPDEVENRTFPERQRRPVVQVLFLSNLVETKGPWEFLQMAKKVAGRMPQVRFVLAGSKVSEKFYQKLVNFIVQEGMERMVKLPGGLYDEAKERAFRESDVFVFPTKREAFPLVNLEAMKWGLPVVSSPVGAIPEMVVDGKTGYIVNPTDIAQLSDRVLKLVRDDCLRLSMGNAGRKRYEDRFTVEAYRENLAKAIGFFEGVLANEAKEGRRCAG
jgi:glycosyltransferase involved in cell wall biosynthesis